MAEAVIYPSNIKNNKDKLLACYSLVQQMIDERNSKAAIARSDRKKYIDSRLFANYQKKEFEPRIEAVLRERERLKNEIRKAAYTDKEWHELCQLYPPSDEEWDTIYYNLYGDKEKEKVKPTLATSPLLDELKLIEIDSLTPVRSPDPTEDFTTYTEYDESGEPGDITLDSNTITLTAAETRSDSFWVYDDKGSEHFSGDFEHKFESRYSNLDASAIWIIWMLNEIDGGDLYDVVEANGDALAVYWTGKAGYQRLSLGEINDGNNYKDYWDGASADTTYYFTLKRVGGDATLYICVNDYCTEGEDLQDILFLDLWQSVVAYQYIYATASYDDGNTGLNASGYVENLDLQEAGAETYQKTVLMDTLLKAQDTEAVNLDAYLRDTDSDTVALSVLLKDTDLESITITALLKALDSKTINLDTLIQALGITKTIDIDTIIKLIATQTIDIDVLLKALAVSKAIDIDTFLQAVDTKTVDIDTLLHGTATLTVDLDVVLGTGGEVTVDLDTLLRGIATESVNIDTLLKASDGKTVNLDAYLRATDTEAISLSALLKAIDTKTVNLDALILAGDTKTVDLDLIIKLIGTETISIDALLKGLGIPKTVALDIILGATFKLVDIDTLLKGQDSETVSLDLMIKALDQQGISLDVLLLARILETVSVDVLLRDTDTKTTLLDAYLKAINLIESVNLDMLIGYVGLSKTAVIDALLRDTDTKTISLSTLVRATDSKELSLDALFMATGQSTIELDSLLMGAGTASVALDMIILGPPRTFNIDVVTSQYRNVNLITLQKRNIDVVKSMKRKIKTILSGG